MPSQSHLFAPLWRYRESWQGYARFVELRVSDRERCLELPLREWWIAAAAHTGGREAATGEVSGGRRLVVPQTLTSITCVIASLKIADGKENKERWRPRPRRGPARLPPRTGSSWETVACAATRRACEASPTTRPSTRSWPLPAAAALKWLTVHQGQFFRLRLYTVRTWDFSASF